MQRRTHRAQKIYTPCVRFKRELMSADAATPLRRDSLRTSLLLLAGLPAVASERSERFGEGWRREWESFRFLREFAPLQADSRQLSAVQTISVFVAFRPFSSVRFYLRPLPIKCRTKCRTGRSSQEIARWACPGGPAVSAPSSQFVAGTISGCRENALLEPVFCLTGDHGSCINSGDAGFSRRVATQSLPVPVVVGE